MTDIASTTDRAAGPPLAYDVPSLEGRRVLLRPVLPSDHEWLYRQAIDARVGVRWRFHGMTPSIDRFLSVFHAGADLSCMVLARQRGEPLGVVQLLDVDHRSRHGYLSVFFAADAHDQGWPLEGLVLFLRYVFRAHDLHKLYVESLGPEVEQYRSMVGTLLTAEGVLRDHHYVFGRYYDSHVFGIYREAWDAAEAALFPSGLA